MYVEPFLLEGLIAIDIEVKLPKTPVLVVTTGIPIKSPFQ